MLRVWSREGPPPGLDVAIGRPPSSMPSLPKVSAAFSPPISIFTRCPTSSSRGLKARVSVSALIAPPASETSWAWRPPKSTASTMKLAGPRPWRSSSLTAVLAQHLRAQEPDDGDAHRQQENEPQQSDAKPLERAPDYVAAQYGVLVPSPRMAPDDED